MPELTPRDGAKIPPRENLAAHEKAMMAEIEALTKSEAAALNAMATAAMRTADATEAMADTLEDLKAILVKVCIQAGFPLPARIEADIKSEDYDPDDMLDDDGDDAEDGDVQDAKG